MFLIDVMLQLAWRWCTRGICCDFVNKFLFLCDIWGRCVSVGEGEQTVYNCVFAYLSRMLCYAVLFGLYVLYKFVLCVLENERLNLTSQGATNSTLPRSTKIWSKHLCLHSAGRGAGLQHPSAAWSQTPEPRLCEMSPSIRHAIQHSLSSICCRIQAVFMYRIFHACLVYVHIHVSLCSRFFLFQ